MKRIVSLILITVLFVLTATTAAFADPWKDESGNHFPPGLAKKGFLPPGIAKKFKDIDRFDWAEKAIEKMALKGVITGYGNGVFAPQKSVTKLEAIIMALRVMGYEEETKLHWDKIKSGKKKLKHKDYVQSWAYGYVSVALDKGILDEVDLLDFKLNEPAERHEVAKYIIRALGYEEEAQEHMDEDLRFIDEGAIPLGSVGYVYLSDKMGIITGYPNGAFLPNKSVTRAEMAVLVARLDDKVDSDIDEKEEYAEIIGIYNNRIKLRIDNQTKTYYVADNVPVYNEDGDYVTVDELETGMKVKILLNDEGTIIFIEIKEQEDEKIVEEYEGIVRDIDDDKITIRVNNILMTFKIADDIEVVFEDDEEGDIDDIKINDEVEVRINEDEEAEYIEVDRELDGYTEYEGTVKYIDDDDITIKVNNVLMSFEIHDDVEVIFEDDEEGDIDDIRVNDEVEIRVNEDDEAVYIEVDRELYEEYEGEVTYIDTVGSKKSIEIDDDEIFTLTNETEVVFENDVEGSIEDIKVGDDVKVKVNKDNAAVYIEVDRELYEEYEGEVTDIDTTGSSKSIEIDDDDVFTLTGETEVVFENDVEGNIEDIKVGDDVKIKVNKDDEAVYIEVDRELYEEYEGVVTGITDDSITLIVSNREYTFEADSDTEVIFEDEEGDMDDLRIGDEVKVIVDEDDEVKYIEADRELDEDVQTWVLVDIYEDDNRIVVKDDNLFKIFNLDNRVKIYVNNDEADIDDLEKDDYLKLTFNNDDEITEIRAYRLEIK